MRTLNIDEESMLWRDIGERWVMKEGSRMMIDDEGANQEGVELANACTVMMLMF